MDGARGVGAISYHQQYDVRRHPSRNRRARVPLMSMQRDKAGPLRLIGHG